MNGSIRTHLNFTSLKKIAIGISILLLILLLVNYLRQLTPGVWTNSIATGLCLGLVAIGVYITFHILDFPDLTIDGSFPLGAAITAAMISAGINPFLTLPIAFFGGALAGVTTAMIAIKLRIHSLLASIITTTALFTIILRIMGRSNIPLLTTPTIFTPFEAKFNQSLAFLNQETILRLSNNLLAILVIGFITLVVKLLFDRFMLTELGLGMQATGANPQMIRALGANTDRMIIIGLALSNGLVGFSGALFSQYQGFADVSMGQGLIIAGLAAVILGETIFRPNQIPTATLAVILGMILYRIAIALALNIKIFLPGGDIFRVGAQDIKLATALIVLLALWFSNIEKRRQST